VLLPDGEVAKLITAAGFNRYGHRDATAVLLAYRHGLRAVELVALRWDSVDFAHGRLHVNRAKNGSPSVHPLSGREQEPDSPFIFTSERGAPFTTAGFRKLIARLGVVAGFDFPAHPHMLRHACGFTLANKGVNTRSLQAYLEARSRRMEKAWQRKDEQQDADHHEDRQDPVHNHASRQRTLDELQQAAAQAWEDRKIRMSNAWRLR
jgi:integrase